MCRIEAQPMAEANDWLEKYREFWEASYQRLDALLEVMKTQRGKRRRKPKKGTH